VQISISLLLLLKYCVQTYHRLYGSTQYSTVHTYLTDQSWHWCKGPKILITTFYSRLSLSLCCSTKADLNRLVLQYQNGVNHSGSQATRLRCKASFSCTRNIFTLFPSESPTPKHRAKGLFSVFPPILFYMFHEQDNHQSSNVFSVRNNTTPSLRIPSLTRVQKCTLNPFFVFLFPQSSVCPLPCSCLLTLYP
jgi:hypothetical protein